MTAESRARVCLLTGATQGIGRAAAEALVPMGVELVLVARDRARLEALATELRARTPGAKVSLLVGDLSRMSEVRRVAADFRAAHKRLHLLLNNAGGLFAHREVTPEGLERTLALNHLAYFVLTEELLPLLKASAPARIVNVSSDAHRWRHIDFDDLMVTRTRYRPFVAYGRTKLMNILFTRELARRLAGTGVTANSLHPGFVATRFGDSMNVGRWVMPLARRFALSPQKGAETIVYLASSPKAEGLTGLYFDKCAPVAPSAEAQDDIVAARLWAESERLAAGRADT